jgi:XisH protein
MESAYLAVPLSVYNSFFAIDFIKEGLEEEEVKVLVYDPVKKEIAKWQK